MATTRDTSGVTFQEKDTIQTASLSNTNGYFPMVQNNVNYKATVPQIKRDAVAICETAADDNKKTATVQNMTDFVLLSGITVTVSFTNTNTATAPELNVNNTGSWPLRVENQAADVTIGSGCWVAGALMECKFIEIGSNKYWLLVGHNKAQVTSDYTVLNDNTSVYSSNQVDSKISPLANLSDLFVLKVISREWIEIGAVKTISNLLGNRQYLIFIWDWSQSSVIDVYFYFCSEANVVRKIISTGTSTVTANYTTSGVNTVYSLNISSSVSHLQSTILLIN